MTQSLSPPPPASSSPLAFNRQTWTIITVVSIVMVLLVLLGVGLSTTLQPIVVSTYWMCMGPVFGILCVWTAKYHARPLTESPQQLAMRQAFHWLGITVALGLEFLLRRAGQEDKEAAGLNALLILALGCYLAGVHLEWPFIFVGLLLTFTLFFVTKAEQYLWLIMLVGGLTIGVLIFLRRMFRKKPIAGR